MGRAPCCEKMGLKRGPWAPEEDQILVSFIRKYGHENWRALPKQAGLLRCGKSCRLRWMNYLRPDIKRGNFTKEEEENIIKLHETLGNRWSAIAERLPGRTDNEIKNVWHTHLKKRLRDYEPPNPKTRSKRSTKTKTESNQKRKSEEAANSNPTIVETPASFESSFSPQSSSSNISSIITDHSFAVTSCVTDKSNNDKMEIKYDEFINDYSYENFGAEIDESFWSDALYTVHHHHHHVESHCISDPVATKTNEVQRDHQFQLGSVNEMVRNEYGDSVQNIMDDGMEFWYDLFISAGGEQELTQF